MDPIRIAYLACTLFSCVVYIATGHKKLLLANQYLVAIFAAFLMVEFLFDLFIAWHMGIFYEQFWGRVQHSTLFPIYAIQGATIILGILNFFKKVRISIKQQIFLVCSFLFLPLTCLYFAGISILSLVLGWHSSHLPICPLYTYLFYFAIGMLINCLIIYFNRLPEFNELTEKDPTMDSLIERSE